MYIFSGLGLLVARIFNFSIGYGIILGRILNFIFFLVMAYFAIKKITFGKLVFAIYMLTPMNLQQVTSISADAIINSVLFYYIAYSIYIIFKKDKLNKKEIVIYVLLTMIIATLKYVYILLAGIGFLIVRRKDLSKKKKFLIITITILLSGIVLFTTYVSSTKYTAVTEATKEYEKRLNVDSEKQISEILNNPKHAIKAFVYDWYNMSGHYIYMSIGSELGWLEITPSETIITLYLIVLISAVFLEENDKTFDIKSKVWLILICMAIAILVEIAMYVAFTPIGAEFIGGIQGRYYIPIYLLLLLCISKNKSIVSINSKIEINNNLFITTLILNLCVMAEVIKYFSL